MNRKRYLMLGLSGFAIVSVALLVWTGIDSEEASAQVPVSVGRQVVSSEPSSRAAAEKASELAKFPVRLPGYLPAGASLRAIVVDQLTSPVFKVANLQVGWPEHEFLLEETSAPFSLEFAPLDRSTAERTYYLAKDGDAVGYTMITASRGYTIHATADSGLTEDDAFKVLESLPLE